MSTPAHGVNRIAYVDGLRACAVLAVVLYHLWLSYPTIVGTGPAAPVLDLLFKMGAHGVDLFFVLSGYCLAYPTLLRLRAGEGLRFDLVSFWAKRLVRIVPPYYAAIAFAVAVLGAANALPRNGATLGTLVSQVLFFDSGVSFTNTSFWTLPIELRWYAVFPLVLWLYAVAPRAVGVAVLALPFLGAFTRVGGVDLGTLPLFVAGIWVADLHVRGVRPAGYALAIALPTAILATIFEPPVGKQFYAIEPVGMVATVAAVIACDAVPALRAVLALRPLAFVGVVSYSVYLINAPVILVAEHAGIAPALALVVALTASIAFFAAVERPIVDGALRRRLVDGLTRGLGRAAGWLGVRAPIVVAPERVAVVEPLRARPSAHDPAQAAPRPLRTPPG